MESPIGKAKRSAIIDVNSVPDKSGKIPKCFSAKRGVHCVSVKNSTIDTSWKNPKAWYINIKTIPIVVRTVTSAHKNNAFSMIFSLIFLTYSIIENEADLFINFV